MIIPKAKTIIDPIIIGLIKYSKDTLPIITIIGFPPAGGWVTLNKIIKQTPKPVANGIVIKMGKGINFRTTIPIKNFELGTLSYTGRMLSSCKSGRRPYVK